MLKMVTNKKPQQQISSMEERMVAREKCWFYLQYASHLMPCISMDINSVERNLPSRFFVYGDGIQTIPRLNLYKRA